MDSSFTGTPTITRPFTLVSGFISTSFSTFVKLSVNLGLSFQWKPPFFFSMEASFCAKPRSLTIFLYGVLPGPQSLNLFTFFRSLFILPLLRSNLVHTNYSWSSSYTALLFDLEPRIQSKSIHLFLALGVFAFTNS